MKHLRLNNNKEYFVENRTAQFLGNIKDINIIIGSNNTRKSRFLRSIINQDHNVIIEGPPELNEAYYNSQAIFVQLEKKGKDAMTEKLFQFQFHETTSPDPRYTAIKQYFNNNSQIDFTNLKTSVTTINEALVSLAVDENFKALQDIAYQTFHVSEVLLWILDYLERHGLPTEKQTNFAATSVKDVKYMVPHTMYERISDFELKKSIIERVRDYIQMVRKLLFERFDKSLIYVPVLRTSRMIGGFLGDVYGETILKQHFVSPTSKLKIETGLMLYEKIGLARNGTRKQSRDFSAFEKFVGQVFFNSDDLHIVAHQTEKKEERNIKISLPGELEDISIYDLGDGIQAIINLLFPVFTAEDGSWILIDEPENHLHPGYQNLLMQTLATNDFIKGKRLRFFINTHSNHILSGALMGPDSAEILVFSRRDMNSSNIQSFNGNEYHTLEKLGVLNTSVLISNCSVWVEGVTDRFYLQSFLYAYCKTKDEKDFKPLEGLHFSFIEYGGKNLIHYEFDHQYKEPKPLVDDGEDKLKNKIHAYFVNANVFLLADSDFNKEKHVFFESIKKTNFKYCKTDLPEIENILPDKILSGFLIEELGVTEDEISQIFPIDHSIKLGKHFQDKINRGKGTRKMEAESGGTLSPYYKKMLADYVHRSILNKTFTWKDLEKSEILKKNVSDLYNFISDKNKLTAC
jgi:AAA15 family ATPase/GTPase